MDKQSWEIDADDFIKNETPFHLGFLVTESSHPQTKTLSKTIQRNTAEGIAQLLTVDNDITKALPNCFRNQNLKDLQESIISSVLKEKRIIFSGCGSTGRLSILLESMWRKGCYREIEKIEKNKTGQKAAETLKKSADGVRGIITGGDRALIKSVENFEDYQEFGRQQVRELNLQADDLFIAISEGGETSSVIGTAHEALDRGCKTFFIFNNPKELLCENIERSKILIKDPRVTTIDLTTGPMAISGSTRMQATTMELVAVGAVLEMALINILVKAEAEINYRLRSLEDYIYSLNTIIKTLQSDNSIKSMTTIVELEEKVYRNKGMVIYTINDFLLDIFTDTTERTPTFSTPPLKSSLSENDDSPWAVALLPKCNTQETWLEMIGRPPNGLNWDSELYKKLGSDELSENPPQLDMEEIYSYKIGAEGLKSYSSSSKVSHIEITVIDSVNSKKDIQEQNLSLPGHRLLISNMEKTGTNLNYDTVIKLPIPASPLRLFTHIALKLIFNTISTATMARLGRIEGNWMIEVTPSNKKLIDRSIRIVSDLKSVSYKDAAYMVFKEIHRNPKDLSSLVARLI